MNARDEPQIDLTRRADIVRVVVTGTLVPVFAGTFGGIALALGSASPAAAATYPGFTTSYYVSTMTTSTLSNAGCHDTTTPQDDATGPHNVILDFGQQERVDTGWGTDVYDVGPEPDLKGTTPSVIHDYKAFANGWEYCNSSLSVYLGIGTNNDPYGTVSTTSGTAWGGVVKLEVAHYVGTNIHPRGADDIELAWHSASSTKDWIGGSSPKQRGATGTAGFQKSGQSYFDYGAATGCVTGCNTNGWTVLGVYDKDYGFAGAVSLPQFYTERQASDWAAVDSSGHVPSYSGAMSTPSLDTPQTAWQYLATATGQYAGSATTIRQLTTHSLS